MSPIDIPVTLSAETEKRNGVAVSPGDIPVLPPPDDDDDEDDDEADADDAAGAASAGPALTPSGEGAGSGSVTWEELVSNFEATNSGASWADLVEEHEVRTRDIQNRTEQNFYYYSTVYNNNSIKTYKARREKLRLMMFLKLGMGKF